LIIKQIHVELTRPHCTATKYAYASDPGGTTPQSITSEMMVRRVYR
jgi:hypothetical protein